MILKELFPISTKLSRSIRIKPSPITSGLVRVGLKEILMERLPMVLNIFPLTAGIQNIWPTVIIIGGLRVRRKVIWRERFLTTPKRSKSIGLAKMLITNSLGCWLLVSTIPLEMGKRPLNLRPEQLN